MQLRYLNVWVTRPRISCITDSEKEATDQSMKWTVTKRALTLVTCNQGCTEGRVRNAAGLNWVTHRLSQRSKVKQWVKGRFKSWNLWEVLSPFFLCVSASSVIPVTINKSVPAALDTPLDLSLPPTEKNGYCIVDGCDLPVFNPGEDTHH